MSAHGILWAIFQYPSSDDCSFRTRGYAHETLAPTVTAAFKVDPACIAVTSGAGVGGPLHNLAARLAGRIVGIVSECSPDFPEWLSRFGAVPAPEPLRQMDILLLSAQASNKTAPMAISPC